MKRSLLVGLNRYAEPRRRLRGCVNDVSVLNDMLIRRYNFRETNLLLNSAATKDRILQELKLLVDTTKPGDTSVFYFSGHGCQVPSVSESDCFDECLVSYDHSWNNPLRDDDIRDCLQNHKPGATLILVVDSCHSGDIDDSDEKRVDWHPPEIAEMLGEKSATSKTRVFGRRDIDTWKQRHILYSASVSDGYSIERRMGRFRRYHGVFTMMLIKGLRTKLKNRKNWYELGKYVNKRVRALTNFKQNPVLTCANENIFNTAFK